MSYMEQDKLPENLGETTLEQQPQAEVQDESAQGVNWPELPGGAADEVAADSTAGVAEQTGEESPEMPDGQPSADAAENNGEGVQEDTPPVEKPKRKRTARKKVEEPAAEEAGDEEASDESQPSGDASDGADAAQEPEHGGEGQDAETAAFVLEEAGDTGVVVPQDSSQEETADGNGDDAPASPQSEEPSSAPKTRRPRRTATGGKAGSEPKEQFARRPLNNNPSLLSLDLNKLDRELTEEEREEWNAIYASYRSKSILTGRIMGIDTHSFTVRSRETGQIERRKMLCAVIINYRVKVLIPETEVWLPEQERPPHVLRNMSGAEIDYTILDVDREGGVAIGSRRMAVLAQRHFFDTVKGGRKLGERLTCRVLAVGPKRCLVECGGRDLNLSQKDLTYTATPDLRERYHPGQTLDCILKEYNRQTGQLWISVKETTANPFFGAIKRHPIGSRRQAKISGKYGGGVFCTLPDETVCLCLYSTRHSDSDFRVGDTVILAIKQFDYDRELIYGRILSKW